MTPKMSFCLTSEESALVVALRARLGRLGALMNRSEVLRLGLSTLVDISDEELAKRAEQMQRLKPGRRARL